MLLQLETVRWACFNARGPRCFWLISGLLGLLAKSTIAHYRWASIAWHAQRTGRALITTLMTVMLDRSTATHPQCIQLVSVKLYDWAMIGVILANCVVLAMTSNAPGFDVRWSLGGQGGGRQRSTAGQGSAGVPGACDLHM